MRLKVLWEVVRDAGEAWLDDRAPRIGAALAFFTARTPTWRGGTC